MDALTALGLLRQQPDAFDPLTGQPVPPEQPSAAFDPRDWTIGDRIARNPLSVVGRGRNALPQHEIANPPLPPRRPADLMPDVPFRATPPLPAPEPVATASVPAMSDPPAQQVPARRNDDANALDFMENRVHPSLSHVGDLLGREGQFREQGRQAGQGMGAGKAAALGLRQGIGLNFDDEVSGLSRASGLPDWTPPGWAAPVGAARMGLEALGLGSAGAGQSYADQRDYARGYHEAATDQHPVANIGAHLAGGLALPTGAAAQGLSVADKIRRGLGIGAAYGAASGAGRGEGMADRAIQAGLSGTIGGTIGGVVPAAAPALGSMLSRVGEAFRPSGASASASPAVDNALAALGTGLTREAESPAFAAGSYGRPPVGSSDAALEAVRSGIAGHLGDASFGMPRGVPGPAADAATDAIRAGLAQQPGMLARGPYGQAAAGSTDDGMAAIREGIMRYLGDPTLGRAAVPARNAGPPFGPYGRGTGTGAGDDPMAAIRAGVLGYLPGS